MFGLLEEVEQLGFFETAILVLVDRMKYGVHCS
jgi:hypothetical protein